MGSLAEIVRFRSECFRLALPEECQVNPEAYGAESAYWLGAALATEGVVTSYPNPEVGLVHRVFR